MKRHVTRDVKASLCISTALISIFGTGTAVAQTNIGSAVQVERNVSGTFGGRTRSLAPNDGVVSNENIKTDNASNAQLRFLDQTTLTIGPTSSVILDRFVYNPDRTARDGTVQMSIGAARWIGGSTPSDAYKVQTPHAVIGVRGTVFDLLVESYRTIVVLREGTIIVCLVRERQRCVTVSAPDSVVVVTFANIRGPTPIAPSESQFADSCLSAVDRRLSFCATQAFAESLNTIATGTPAQKGDRWLGFYVGANLGYSWGNLDNSASVDPFAYAPFSFVFPGGSSSATAGVNGVIGGVQLGYNWRIAPRWLAGLEADIQASGQKGSALGVFSGFTTNTPPFGCTDPICAYTNTTDITAKLSWFGTVRARAGVERNGTWFYGTGGFAYGRITVSGTNTFTVTDAVAAPPTTVVFSTPFSYSKTKLGWVAGVGAEGRLGVGKLTWKIEYLHIDLGSIGGGSFGSIPLVTVNSTKFTDEIVRVGINYPLSN